MEIIGDFVDYDRVTCIVAALAPSAKVGRLAENIYKLALALFVLVLIQHRMQTNFVSPLGCRGRMLAKAFWITQMQAVSEHCQLKLLS
jgi:hypothetical protein